MARNTAAQTAFGPIVQAAIEQYEPPEHRLVYDDLAVSLLPAGQHRAQEGRRRARTRPGTRVSSLGAVGLRTRRSDRRANK